MLYYQKRPCLADFNLSESIIQKHQEEGKKYEKKQDFKNKFIGILVLILYWALGVFIPFAILKFCIKESFIESLIGGLTIFFFGFIIIEKIAKHFFDKEPLSDLYDIICEAIIPDNKPKRTDFDIVEQRITAYKNYCNKIKKEYPRLEDYNFNIELYSRMIMEEILNNIVIITKRNNEEYSKKWWKELSPFEFEKQTADWFSKQGYKSQVTKKTGDGGVDVVLTKDKETIYVQCKHYNYKITLPYVRDFYGAMTADKVSKGIIVCLDKGLTSEASSFAQKVGIQIITLDDLAKDEALENLSIIKIANYYQIGNQTIINEIFESYNDASTIMVKTELNNNQMIVSSLKELSKTTKCTYTRNAYFILCTNNYNLWKKYEII